MYKLTMVTGPKAGTSYALQEGETTLGRKEGNGIVLSSSKISKQHCAFIVSGEDVTVQDLGSSNGTFVNGSLIKTRKLKVGDRVSVGDFILELRKPVVRQSSQAPAVVGLGDSSPHVQLQNLPPVVGDGAGGGGGGGSMLLEDAVAAQTVPTDFKGKALWYFEKYVMPIFYSLNLKQEWHAIGLILFFGYVVLSMIISVYPLLQANELTIVRESARRAQLMARQIADMNAPALAAKAETKTEISASIRREPGVTVAALVDLQNRIIAPTDKMNQYLAAGGSARLAVQAAKAFSKGRETGIVQRVDSETVAAVEPVKVFDPRQGANRVVAMAVVGVDTAISTPDMGSIGMTYAQTFILTGILGALVLLVLYRLTLKRFEVLNEDIDKVLKGDMGQVTQEMKTGELDSLWDVINAALQRIPKGSGASGGALGGGGDDFGIGGGASSFQLDDVASSFQVMADAMGSGLLVLDGDQRIVSANSRFEDITGIDAHGAIGQEMGAVARDDAFKAMASDLLAQAQTGGSAADDFEFSGIPYRLNLTAIGEGSPKGYVLTFVRAGGE